MKTLLTYAAALLLATMVAVAQPAPNQPPNGATDLPTNVTLGWRPLKIAVSYDVEISLNSTFTQIYNILSTDSTTLEAANLGYSTTYYWHVRGVDAAGEATGWSADQSFTTVAATGIPQPISPADGATDQPTSVMLQWSSVPGAGQYEVQWSSDPTFPAATAQTATVGGTSHPLPTLGYATTIYWHVRLSAVTAGPGPWSRYAVFTTGLPLPDPLAAPLLVSPANGEANQPEAVTLVWHRVEAKEPVYEVEVATDPSFANVAYSDGGLTDTTYGLRNLPAGQTYHWHVRADNGEVKSEWSGVFKFTTAPESPISLLAPQLLSPPNGAANAPLTVTMTWDSIPDAADYEIEFGTDAAFDSVDTTLTSRTTSAELAALPNATTFHWRTRARNGAAASAWSTPFRFTTESAEPQLPSMPELLSPPNLSSNIESPVQLRWKSASNAQSYVVELSNSGEFTGEQTKLTTTAAAQFLDTLPEGTKQWWRVHAANQYGRTEPTAPWSFTTKVNAPTGVEEEITSELNARIYPIPASAAVTVQLPEPATSPAIIQLFSAHGAVAIATRIEVGATATTLQTGGLPAGIYWCVVQAGKLATGRTVVIVK